MARNSKVTVTLTPALERFVERGVKLEMYDSPSEVVREGLRLLHDRQAGTDAALAGVRADLVAGLDQANRGELIELDEAMREIEAAINAPAPVRRRKAG